MKKRLLALVLSLGLCLGMTVPASAYDMGYSGGRQFLTSGNSNTAFVKPDGTLWGFGSVGYLLGNMSGNLSTIFGSFQTAPLKLMDHVTSASIGLDHMAAIQADGSLWVWGNSRDGQVGNGVAWDPDGELFQETTVSSPVKIMDNVAAVSCGYDHTAAVKTDGSVWTWGNGDYGQLGNGDCGEPTDTDTVQSRPIKIMDGVKTVSCGSSYTAALKTDGSLWMWGDNSGSTLNRGSALGNGGKGNTVHPSSYGSYIYYCQTVPTKIMDNVVAVSCGGSHTAAIKTDGSLWMWGSNAWGQLGNGTLESKTRPVKIMDNVRAVSCGSGFTAVIKTDNTLWIWGSNAAALGDDGVGNAQVTQDGITFTVQTTPVKILDNVAAVSCGGGHGAAVQMNGSLWTWGSDSNGQLGRGITDEKEWYRESQVIRTPIKVMDGGVALPEGVEPPVPTVGGFSDVRENAYFADAVLWAVENGITSGTTATTFGPDVTCTTAQILTFLWRANGSPAPAGSNAVVPAGQYYSNAANWALEKGLTDTFNADTPATRAATMTYLWKLAGKPAADAASFTDVTVGAEYAQAVAWAVKEGITSGTSSTTFSPDNICTRAQIMTFLYRDFAK